MNKTKQLRLLIITDFFYPHWTGISKSLFYLIKALDRDLLCTVLTVRYHKDLRSLDKILNTKIIREDVLFSLSRSKYSPRVLLRLLIIINQHDVVLINSPSSNILPAAVITKLFRKKLLIFHQGDLILPEGIANRIVEKIFDISAYLACVLSDKVSTYTKDYAKYSRLLKNFHEKFTPIILPILIPGSLLLKKRQNKYIYFGFAGRFVEEKGFDILLDAIPEIVNSIPNARFRYAGQLKMGYERFFEKNKNKFDKLKKYIDFCGLLSDKEMLSFYDSIDFIIVPSRSDCFNLVQAEAMKSGVPSIAADIPGLRVLVKQTGFGVLFEKNNSVDLARKSVLAVAQRKKIMLRLASVKTILDDKLNVKKITNFITK